MALGNKEIMARNIKFQMAKKGINQTELCNTLGFKPMTVSDWLRAKTYPRIDKIELMAQYFGITKAELVEDHTQNTEEAAYYLNPETARVAQEIFENSELRILFDAARDASPEDLRTTYKILLDLKSREKK